MIKFYMYVCYIRQLLNYIIVRSKNATFITIFYNFRLELIIDKFCNKYFEKLLLNEIIKFIFYDIQFINCNLKT